MDIRDDGAGEIVDSELSKDVFCSVILQGLDELTFAYMMAHQDDMQEMWKFLRR